MFVCMSNTKVDASMRPAGDPSMQPAWRTFTGIANASNVAVSIVALMEAIKLY